MIKKNGRKTKVRQKREDSQFNRVAGCVGNVSSSSSRTWTDSIGASRNDRHQSNSPTGGFGKGISGGIARQLIEEARKQLAYHKNQVSEIEKRILELEQFTEKLTEEED